MGEPIRRPPSPQLWASWGKPSPWGLALHLRLWRTFACFRGAGGNVLSAPCQLPVWGLLLLGVWQVGLWQVDVSNEAQGGAYKGGCGVRGAQGRQAALLGSGSSHGEREYSLGGNQDSRCQAELKDLGGWRGVGHSWRRRGCWQHGRRLLTAGTGLVWGLFLLQLQDLLQLLQLGATDVGESAAMLEGLHKRLCRQVPAQELLHLLLWR